MTITDDPSPTGRSAPGRPERQYARPAPRIMPRKRTGIPRTAFARSLPMAGGTTRAIWPYAAAFAGAARAVVLLDPPSEKKMTTSQFAF